MLTEQSSKQTKEIIETMEEAGGTNAKTLPVISGKLMPWRRGGSILGDQVAEFRAEDREPLGPWIPGDEFKVESGGLVYTLAVLRYFPAERTRERSVLSRGGLHGRTWKVTRARTIPEFVLVRVLAVEPAPRED